MNSTDVITSNPTRVTPQRLFIVRYTLEVPIYVIGLFLNSYVAYMFLRNDRNRFRESRLNRIITYLVGACLLWSAVSCFRYFEWLVDGGMSTTLNTIYALLAPICLVSILGLNLMLAMERFFVMRQRSDIDTKTDDSVLPNNELQATVWIWSTAVYYITVIVAIITLYISTFLHTRKILRMYRRTQPSSAKDVVQNQALFQIERKVLFYSVCFGLVVIVCYLPEILMNGCIIVRIIDPHTQGDLIEVWKCVANVFVACDSVITPLLVLFVGPKDQRHDEENL
ncbi:hypothetical protein BCR33DRAFT_790763 [Rhizoclosmatium globosum]|uniref:G-protein coupled receptors family 1 profile domain-containing protein n=1 Tax=Rhizoclosmatium globosum TaxID=329046 RepID=A0A1Y2BKS3_9FUNG|nr:hypothetical protein BCR33DRAFT_790763 [Rhizoclosmatium globosum]|eukprot:ORY35207.1 hypothetical protein BCR33DRAFT_790763 [Rhizoclosmatium globosum]